MRNSKDAMEEILAELKLLSHCVLISESILEELSLFRADTNEKIQELECCSDVHNKKIKLLELSCIPSISTQQGR